MKGDFTRFPFYPKKHYSGVFKQQGRVDLDADWNEYVEMQRHIDRIRTRDIIGPCGVPVNGKADEESGGFKITVDEQNEDLKISPGNIYVDGILCQLEDSTTYLGQKDYPGRPKLGKSGTYLVYLDVWIRHITAIEDPEIRETALGGPDTTTRIKTVWQVKVEKVGEDVKECADVKPWGQLSPTMPSKGHLTTSLSPSGDTVNPCTLIAEGGYIGLENRLYRVEIHNGGDTQALSNSVSPGTHFGLHSVETINGANELTVKAEGWATQGRMSASGKDVEKGATFKWSRDNGSVVFPIEEFGEDDRKIITLKRLGRDQVLTLHNGDWVEVLDDVSELSGSPGTLAQIVGEPNQAAFTISLSQEIPSIYQVKYHAKVRRWDQKSDAIAVNTDNPIYLEDGIRIQFSGSNFTTGDYWVFAARTTGEVETLVNAPPRGIEHHYCKLALIKWTSNDNGVITADVTDCRKKFKPLTELGSNGSCCCTATVGDGVTSHGDFDNIQEGIDFVIGKGAGRVCILPGSHKLLKTITINDFRPKYEEMGYQPYKAVLTIYGCGPQTQIFGPENLDPAFQLDKSALVQFDSLTFEVKPTQNAVFLKNHCFLIKISDCIVNIAKIDQIEGEDDISPLMISDSKDIIIENNFFICPSTYKYAAIAITGSKVIQFSGNKLSSVGIWVHDGSKNIIIRDNSISGASAGIILGDKTSTSDDSQVAGITITDNFIVEMDNSGICTMMKAIHGDPVFLIGIGAVEGTTIGIVRIITSADDLDKVKQGDIMVTKMTANDMLPAMKRAGAIVTDDGDCNCHAATVSREFDSPRPGVVVRTNTATLDLKDGMKVRVMGDKGTVEECQEALGSDIADLIIDRNRIFRCAKKGIDERFDNEAVGGIVLRDISGLRISGNYIAKNGYGFFNVPHEPACGVFVSMCQGLEIKDNLITDNGVKNDYTEPEEAYQAGIVALHVTGGSLPAGYLHDLAEAGLSGLRAGVSSATITDNVVVTPRGHALIIVGLGPMRIADNSLTTLGKWSQPVYKILNSKINQCVCIINYGIALELAAFDLIGPGEKYVGENYTPKSIALGAVPFVKLREVLTDMAVNGQVLFHGNQVTFQTEEMGKIDDPPAENVTDEGVFIRGLDGIVKDSIGSPIIIASGDDVSFQDNQILIESIGEFVISSVTTLAPTVRASCNRFSELIPSIKSPLRGSLISYLSLGYMNIATDNQATRCLLVFGLKNIQSHNQIAYPILCDNIKSALVKMVTSLFENDLNGLVAMVTGPLSKFSDAQDIRASRKAYKASRMNVAYGETHPNSISAQKDSIAAEKLARSLRKMNDLLVPTIPMLHPKDWLVFGRVLKQDGKPAKGLEVQVFDREKKRGDLLRNAGTDENGNFSIIYPYSPPIEGELPDLYLTVKDAKGNVLFSSEKAMRYEADKAEYYKIVLERATM